MQYKSEVARNLREIARQLGVAHVVEGNVRRAGNRMRVSAQLIDARNDRHLWAETYDRELADVLGIQADVAQRIANELGAKLSPTEKAQMQRKPTENGEAYLAIGSIQRRQGKWTESTTNLEKAVALNPNVVWPLQNLAFNYVALRNFKSANKTIDRMIALDPTALAPLEMKSRLGIFEKGDSSVAEKVFEAVKSAPLSPEQKIKVAVVRAELYLLERKYQEGLEAAENLPDDKITASRGVSSPGELSRKYYYIGFARKALHDEAGARSAFLKAKSATEEELRRTGGSEDTHIHLAKVLAYLGEKESALTEAQRATELLPESKDAFDGPVITTGVAQVYSILGDNDRAIQILQGLLSRPSPITVRTLKL